MKAGLTGLVTLMICVPAPAQGNYGCIGDINLDGAVNGADLGLLQGSWGPSTAAAYSRESDLTNDGQVDGADLALLLGNWGACASAFAPPWAELVDSYPDPGIVPDASLRIAIAATGLAWRVRDTVTQIEMLLVPPGSFMMGCAEPPPEFTCSTWALPVHHVTITQPFYLGRFELTQAQYAAGMGFNPSHFQGLSESASRPVENLTVHQMRAFVQRVEMRFPSEAEWEYACRAGTTSAYHNGTSDPETLDAIAWFVGNAGAQTRPVGQKLPNRLGFSDMLGNVAEWVEGCQQYYTSAPRIDPVDPACPSESPWSFTSPRGGAWAVNWQHVQSSTRFQIGCCGIESGRSSAIGLRVARNP